jgi:hypothetical protein
MKIQRDFLNGYITSNNLFPLALSNTTSADASDRRLLVARCERILTESEANALFAEINENAAWIGAYLMRYQPQYKWNPGWAPVTEHKRLIMERDRERAEHRADKFELGKFDEFYYLMQWAKEEKIGGFIRKVVTGEICRDIAVQHRVKYPHESSRFDRLLERAGIKPGPRLKVDGSWRRFYSLDDEMQGKPDEVWKSEYSKSLESFRV